MCANGSPGSTFPANVRNTGRVASSRLESVTTMSRIGCASAATSSHTPMASNSRRQAATMAVARGSRLGRSRQRRIGDDDGNIGAKALAQRQRQRQPANAPPPITMLRCADMLNPYSRGHRLYLLHDYSWAKQGRETRVLNPHVVIPGRGAASNPESERSMTAQIPGSRLAAPRNDAESTKALRCPKA